MKRWPQLSRRTTGLIIIGLAVLLGLGGLAYWRNNQQTFTLKPVDSTYRYICKSDQPNSLSCYGAKYQKLTIENGVPAAFTQLKADYQTDGNVQSYCHQLAHVIGRTAADRANNVDEAYAQGDNFCWSGFYHGAIESIAKRIGQNNIASKLPIICSNIKNTKPYSFYHFNCVHGMGHGIMGVTDNDLFGSLATCDRFEDNWERESCYGGAFMENEMSEVNSDHQTKYFKDDDLMYPCTGVDDKYKAQCYLMQTSHVLRAVNQDFARVFNECAKIESSYRNICYQSLGRDASGNSNSAIEPTKERCLLGADQTAQANCVIGAVKDFISYHHSDQQANNFCLAFDNPLQTTCQSTKKSYYATFL